MERLGQHFLHDTKAVQTSIAAADITAKSIVLEIGPGKGALTFLLAEECKKNGASFFAIEKDKALKEKLESDLKKKNIPGNILYGDVLKILPQFQASYPETREKDFIIIGNIPYYITGKLLRVISELKEKPKRTILMIQKEVALRIAAKPGEMNLLAAATQIWAEPKILLHVPKTSFKPKPKVDSSIILLTSKQTNLGIAEEEYYAGIKTIFRQPRKTLFNNLRSSEHLSQEQARSILKDLRIQETMRPQELSLTLLIKIVHALSKSRVI